MTMYNLLLKNLKTTFELGVRSDGKRMKGVDLIPEMHSHDMLDEEITVIRKKVYLRSPLNYAGISFINKRSMEKTLAN